jgi:hypothetical protein
MKEEINLSPEIITADPVDRAGEQGISITISAIFNTDMNPASINPSTFLVKAGTKLIQGTITYANKKATFTPLKDLDILTDYSAVITTGAQSSSGKSMEREYAWSFGTCHPPEVVSTTPKDGATCFPVNQAIMAVFNHDINPATVTTSTFLLSTGATSVSGTVSFSGVTATFTPTVNLLLGTVYTATITTGIINNVNMHLEHNYSWQFTTYSAACELSQDCPPNINLKTAAGYGILAGVGITNTGFSVIHDMNVGISPGFRSSVTGFPPGTILNGQLFAADDVAPPGAIVTQARADLTAAYLVAQAATSPTPVIISADLGGRTLGPGIYTSTSTMLLQSGDLTLDAGQSPCASDAVWIFQVGSALTSVGGAGGNVILINGAKADHVFWQVGSSATIGDGTSFKGTVMALTSITMGSGAKAEGRMLARNGAVTLTSTNILTKP